jgi:hypothetical protein
LYEKNEQGNGWTITGEKPAQTLTRFKEDSWTRKHTGSFDRTTNAEGRKDMRQGIKSTFVIAGLGVLLGAAVAVAAENDEAAGRPTREQVIAKFDLDGDGQLSKEERRAVGQACAAARQGGPQGENGFGVFKGKNGPGGPKGRNGFGGSKGENGHGGAKGENGHGKAEGDNGHGAGKGENSHGGNRLMSLCMSPSVSPGMSL